MSTITPSPRTSNRRPSVRRAATRRTSTEVALTPDGRALLQRRLESLYTKALPAYRPLLVGPERDERDVAAFERLVGEVQRLEAVLGCAVDAPTSLDGSVVLGSTVAIAMPDGERVTVRPVHPAEAALDNERISVTSPLSQALLGRKAGERVTVHGPAGDWDAVLVEVT